MPPTIAAIANVSLNRGQTLDVPVRVTDADGDTITLSATNALTNMAFPHFATFTDQGGGHGVFHFAPGIADRGAPSVVEMPPDPDRQLAEVLRLAHAGTR